MTAITPSQASQTLEIQPSTLRKYSLLLQEYGVQFKRAANDSRVYTSEDLVTLQKMITLIKAGGVTVKEAAYSASRIHIGESSSVTGNVTHNDEERHDSDIALALVSEIKSLREQIEGQQETIDSFRESQEKRDAYFVEILEDLNGQIKQLNEQQTLPEPEIQKESEVVSTPKKENFLSKLFKRKSDDS